MSENDIFIINKIYPNAKDIFTLSVEPILKIKDNCLFVLDTNALLLPYTITPSSIDEIKKVYTKIIEENRLFIPAQVAREFAKNRPEKIKDIFLQFNRKKSKVNELKIGKYPLLTGIQEYEDLVNYQKEIDDRLKEYSEKVNAIIDKIKAWTWNDPVSQIYHALFQKEIIIDHNLKEADIIKELKIRYLHKIPPGYKDGKKEDDGIGDLLIWFTILDLAEKENKDIVFVSGDEKTDWFHRSEGQSLYPRFELISEFRTKAPEKSFSIIKLSEFIELFGADQKVVEEVESEENIININYFFSTHEISYVGYINDWIRKNIKGFNILTYESGFPEIVLVDDTNGVKTIAVEIMVWREISPFLMSLSSSLEKFTPMALENGYSKLIIFVVIKPVLVVPTIIDEIKSFKQNFELNELEIEIVLGRIVENNFTVTLII
ncbi:PIN domain-containing protein [Chryseobacterium tongliaoense]|uniref:PIN domain-containing protein n=1 Tax=Chryseobacterium tongliaoense TaxID=3240933 RepID=UPI003513C2F4